MFPLAGVEAARARCCSVRYPQRKILYFAVLSCPPRRSLNAPVIREREKAWVGCTQASFYETCTILFCLLKNSSNSSEKNETNSAFSLKKLDLPNCRR
jgi:hypothetical protein